MKYLWPVLLFASGIVLGFFLHRHGALLAGPPFLVKDIHQGYYICVAEFDKNGQLVRKGP